MTKQHGMPAREHRPTRTGSRRRRLQGAAAALACALCLAGAAPGLAAAQTSEVDDDPAVLDAELRAGDASERLRAVEAELDRAAAAFEHAQAHHLRLQAELEGSGALVARAEQSVSAAQSAVRARAVEAYTRPPDAMAMLEAVLDSPDAATVLHRAGLLDRATVASADALRGRRLASELTVDAVRQHVVVAAGSDAAAQERQAAADALAAEVAQAQGQLEVARADVERARAEAEHQAEERRRAEERRQAEERRRTEERRQAEQRLAQESLVGGAGQSSATVSRSAPLPAVNGKVCPIGTPNGFIDSWGFPRSGGRRHQGVDMFAAYGTPLYAVADGTVQRVSNSQLGGLSIHLVDEAGDRYYYAHLSAASVVDGQRVRAGEVVGANGNSGNARTTPPHLHWQYHPGGGAPVNPYPLAAALCRTG